jgi:hypothetical protein
VGKMRVDTWIEVVWQQVTDSSQWGGGWGSLDTQSPISPFKNGWFFNQTLGSLWHCFNHITAKFLICIHCDVTGKWWLGLNMFIPTCPNFQLCILHESYGSSETTHLNSKPTSPSHDCAIFFAITS